MQQGHQVLGERVVVLERGFQVVHIRGQGGGGRGPLLGLGGLPGIEVGDLLLAVVAGDVVHHAREERFQVRVEAGCTGASGALRSRRGRSTVSKSRSGRRCAWARA